MPPRPQQGSHIPKLYPVGVIVDGRRWPAAIEIEGGVIRALYVVRNVDELRHLATSVRATGL